MPINLIQRDFRSNGVSSVPASGSDHVRFQQQGQVDWTNLSTNSLNASIQVLSRISAAGIDPFTIVIGQAIGGSLLWRDPRRRRFDEALQQCHGLASYRNILWFGFGVKHIAHIITATDQGATCAALCACLAECYSTTFTAGILMEMTKASKPSTETVPSLAQWRSLVDSCAGLVTNSTFGVRAEQLMRLEGNTRIACWGSRCDQSKKSRGVASKADIADTLLGLSKLSRGILHQMTIIGRADAGLIAAIADWLLDLTIEIKDSVNQSTLYKNCEASKNPELLIIFEKDVPETSLQCAGQTYRLPDATELIRREALPPTAGVLSGRLLWEKAFSHTFGEDFNALKGMAHAFGAAIGCAAVIYQALFEGNESTPREWQEDCPCYFSASFGLDYVHFILNRFPELEDLRSVIITKMKSLPVPEAISQFEAQITSIAMGCGCWRCSKSGEKSHATSVSSRDFCLVYVTYSIIKLSRALSGIVTELSPMRAGLELYYDECLSRSSSLVPPGKKSPTAQLPPTFVANIVEVYSAKGPSIGGETSLLDIAGMLFGSQRKSVQYSPDQYVSAFAENGLSYFLDVLVDPSADSARASKVHIVGGRIEYAGRPYHQVRDGSFNMLPPRNDSNWPPQVNPRILALMESSYGGELEALVTEELESLSFEFGASKNSSICGTFGPAGAVQSLLCSEGLVRCPRNSTCGNRHYTQKLRKPLKIVDVKRCHINTSN